MRVEKEDPNAGKGWYVSGETFGCTEPWATPARSSTSLICTGAQLRSIWSLAATLMRRVEHETVRPELGDVLVVEPGAAHSMLASSPDYFHFVVHLPGLPAEEARADNVMVLRERLGPP